MADTVALMKQRVLDMAIRGELVDQRPEEDSADTLIGEIILEKKRRKKGVNISVVTDEEKPFDLPKNWRWIKFGDLVHFQIGKTPARGNKIFWDNGVYPWVSIADMNNGEILNNTKETVSEEAKNIVFKGGISPRGTLIMSFKLTIGKLAILDMDAFHNEAIISIYPNHDESDTIRDYLFYIINGLDLLRDTKAAIKGATLNKTSLNEILVPLPPLSEQKRIVAKIEEIFAVIDQIGTKKEEALSIIRKMRQTALQDAIMGVLVDQEDTNEPASILYEKIQAEKERLVKEKKIKKEKPLPGIEEDEIPFEIPKSWKWVRLADISKSIVAGGDKPKEFSLDKTDEYTIPVIANGIKNNGIVGYSKEATIHEESITVSGRGTIGYSAIRSEPFRPIVRLLVINPSKQLSVPYLKYTLDALLETGVGTSIQQLTVPMIKPKVIPLPPLAEQQSIVEKLDDIMAICDQMETIFDGTSEMNTNLNVV